MFRPKFGHLQFVSLRKKFVCCIEISFLYVLHHTRCLSVQNLKIVNTCGSSVQY